MRLDLVVGLSLCSLCVLAQGPSQASQSPYKVRLAVDLPLTVGLIGGATALELTAPDTVTLSCHPCSRADLNPLDRGVVAPRNTTIAHVTDAMVALAIASPFLVSGADELWGRGQASAEGWFTDGLVIAETLGATLLMTQIAKYAVKRPRPFTYTMDPSESDQVETDDSLSFYSGHTAMAFAGVVSALQTLSRRGHKGPGFAVATGVGLALATGVGLGRVRAARHFWTDVMMGAAVGSLMGIVVPWVHARGAHEPKEGEQDALQLRLAPLGVAGTF